MVKYVKEYMYDSVQYLVYSTISTWLDIYVFSNHVVHKFFGF